MKSGKSLADMPLESANDFFITMDNNFFIRSDGGWYSIWLGSRLADGDAIQQLMDLSGYSLSGNRLMNNLILEPSDTVISPDAFGNWSEYLKWTEPRKGIKYQRQ